MINALIGRFIWRVKLLSLVLLSVFLFAKCNSGVTEKDFVYIGTYTDGVSKGIYLSSFDNESGKLETPKLAYKMENPSYLAVSISGDYLFAVSEKDEVIEDLFSFRINHDTGELYFIDAVSTDGRGACYVEEIDSGLIGVAHYNSGDVVFISHNNGIFDDGSMQQFAFEGGSINESRQESSHIHSVIADCENKFVYVADLGRDKIEIFDIQSDSVKHIRNVEIELGAGPRLVTFHPYKNQMAVINELNGTVIFYEKDSVGMFVTPFENVILNEENNQPWSADIKYSSSGDYLFVTERFDNKVYSFAVSDYEVNKIDVVTEGIDVPRSFAISKEDKYLVVASQEGQSVASYKLRPGGTFEKTEYIIEVDRPVCVIFKKK